MGNRHAKFGGDIHRRFFNICENPWGEGPDGSPPLLRGTQFLTKTKKDSLTILMSLVFLPGVATDYV